MNRNHHNQFTGCEIYTTPRQYIYMDAKTQESQWISDAQKGSREAFGKLIEAHHVGIRAYLLVRIDNPHDAEDLAQDTFITAFKKLNDFDISKPLGPWLRGIAFRLLANYRKKHKPSYIGANEELDGLIHQTIEKRQHLGSEAERLEALKLCMQELNPESQSLIHTRYLKGKSLKELCKTSNRKHSAIAMQLHRIRHALKLCIEGKVA